MKEYVAYEGRKFSIEWYFTENGKSQPLDFFNALSASEQQKFFYLVKRMGISGSFPIKQNSEMKMTVYMHLNRIRAASFRFLCRIEK